MVSNYEPNQMRNTFKERQKKCLKEEDSNESFVLAQIRNGLVKGGSASTVFLLGTYRAKYHSICSVEVLFQSNGIRSLYSMLMRGGNLFYGLYFSFRIFAKSNYYNY